VWADVLLPAVAVLGAGAVGELAPIEEAADHLAQLRAAPRIRREPRPSLREVAEHHREHALGVLERREPAAGESQGIGYTDTSQPAMNPAETLQAFDRFLADRGLRLEAIVVGGTALNLLGVTSRQTRDCDVLEPPLDAEVLRAARDFAAELRGRGEVLGDEWLNNGPAQLASVLPPGWRERLQPAFHGSAIELQTLGRADLLKVKLFALCDRGIDLGDCVALRPTEAELADALPWLEVQDLHPQWPTHVRATLADLGRRLGHGV